MSVKQNVQIPRVNKTRQVPTALKALQWSQWTLNLISPWLAGRWLYHLWFKTHRFAEPGREARWRDASRQMTLTHENKPLTIYSWGEGPVVLLLHGWNGRGTQMGALARSLAEVGHRAIAMDAPAHGRTPGNSTTLFHIADALNRVADEFGPVKGVVTHSFGAMVLTYALRHGLEAEKAVCICPPANPEFLLDSFCGTLHASAAARRVFEHFFTQDYGEDIWKRISAEINASKLNLPALILHDKNDEDIPWQMGEDLSKAWPGARFHLTRGLGHNRILRHPSTVQSVIDFMNS